MPKTTKIRPKPANPAVLMQQAHPELRRIAGQQFQRERPGHTWQPTELVHEVFLRLAESGPAKYTNRAHFFGTRGARHAPHAGRTCTASSNQETWWRLAPSGA